MATNNVINLNASGIASYDGAGTFSALANPLTVSNGGTTDSSLTAYSVLCGGTTSTGAIQSLASTGTSGQILKSAGAGVLPSFAASTYYVGGYIASWSTTATSLNNPADGQTYYLGAGNNITTFTASGEAATRFTIPQAGTITKAYGVISILGTLGSNENTTLAIRLNNTSNINIKTTVQLTANPTSFNNTGLSQAVVEGDYLELIMICPTWGTNPLTVNISCAVLIT